MLFFVIVKCIYKTDNLKYAKERRKIVPEKLNILISVQCVYWVLEVSVPFCINMRPVWCSTQVSGQFKIPSDSVLKYFLFQGPKFLTIQFCKVPTFQGFVPNHLSSNLQTELSQMLFQNIIFFQVVQSCSTV